RSLRILAGESSERAERGGTQVRVAEPSCACGSTHCGRANLSEHLSRLALLRTSSANAYSQRHSPLAATGGYGADWSWCGDSLVRPSPRPSVGSIGLGLDQAWAVTPIESRAVSRRVIVPSMSPSLS